MDITDYLEQLSSVTYCPKTPFHLHSFLDSLDTNSTQASRMFRHNIHHGSTPKPGEIWFPNGTSTILLLDETDLYSVTDDPDVNDDIVLATRENCGLLLTMNDALQAAVQHCPELDDPSQFPLEPILQMLCTLEWLEDRGMRHLIVQAIRRVFLERSNSYSFVSPR
ncbi:MAG: hypothetical protein LW834_21815 [Cyanobium sp. 49614_E6]|jgi:hypothetical protein|nr:hypothetical protein [Cyanobium sp. 49614_E6]MCE2839548.1 hypothetical protein [Cyanobium sp. 49614_E6]